jgi:PadR family transcriptional regulator
MDIPHLSPKEVLILRLILARGEMYGLELVTESKGELKRGTVYVTLGRMAEKGYVESRTVPQDDGSGMPKRLFRATGHGETVLRALELASDWMAQGPSRKRAKRSPKLPRIGQLESG